MAAEDPRNRSDRIDPAWPSTSEEDHPVAELTSSQQGASSPFGELEFPLDDIPYIHPRSGRGTRPEPGDES